MPVPTTASEILLAFITAIGGTLEDSATGKVIRLSDGRRLKSEWISTTEASTDKGEPLTERALVKIYLDGLVDALLPPPAAVPQVRHAAPYDVS